MLDLLPQVMQFAKQSNNQYLNVLSEDRDSPFLPELYRIVRTLRAELHNMQGLVGELKVTTTEKLHSIDGKNVGQQIERTVDEINGIATKLRAQLDALGQGIPKIEQAADAGLGTLDRIKFNIHASLMASFVRTMQEYQDIQNVYQESSKQLLATQIRLKNPNATDEEIKAKINSGDSAQLQLASNKLDLANESYNYVVARHKEVLKLEKSLQEVHQLFVDMAALVDQQGEVIDRIAFRISNAKADVAAAKEELTEAYRIKKRTCSIQ